MFERNRNTENRNDEERDRDDLNEESEFESVKKGPSQSHGNRPGGQGNKPGGQGGERRNPSTPGPKKK